MSRMEYSLYSNKSVSYTHLGIAIMSAETVICKLRETRTDNSFCTHNCNPPLQNGSKCRAERWTGHYVNATISEVMEKYLLSPEDLLLLPEFVYMDMATGEYSFIYYPERMG